MAFSRRTFIRTVGVTLASLVVGGEILGCGVPGDSNKQSAWDRLRQDWLNLRDLDFETDVEPRKAAHRATLDELVEAGELNAAVADQMQLAFAEAAYHVQRSLATCYIALPLEYYPRQDLVQQAELLEQVAGDLDPAVLDKARAAIARDMAFFEAAAAREPDRDLYERYERGELEADAESLEAARVLADLLLGRALE